MHNTGAAAQHADFAARIERIRADRRRGGQVIHIGMDDTIRVQGRNRAAPSARREVAGNLLYPLGFVFAFLLGASAQIFGQYVRFQVMGLADAGLDPDMDMMVAGGMGMAASFVLAQLFRLRTKDFGFAQVLGVFASVCAMHNLVHLRPDLFELAFSREWVAQMIAATEPMSIVFRGMTFTL